MIDTNHIKVYFSKNISPEAVDKLLDCINLKDIIFSGDFTAIKTHFGEKGNEGYVRPELVKVIVKKVKKLVAIPFVTDTNTIYVSERTNAVNHLEVAYEHGFYYDKVGCPVIIADGLRGNSYVEVELASRYKTRHFNKVKIANAIYYADSIVFVTHLKGHEMSGFGGALKNIGMGCAARAGKYEQHNSVVPQLKLENCNGCGICIKWCPGSALRLTNKVISLDITKCTGCGECILSCNHKVFKIPWDESVKNVQEKMVEYCLGVLMGEKNKRAVYLNFLNFITKYCDCYETKEKPLIDEIGILASTDPVAIDQASTDLVNEKFWQKDFFRYIWPEIDYEIQLKYAEELGLGNRNYKLVEIR